MGRGEILAFVFAVGAFRLYVQKKHPVGVGLLFFLALCSKESAAFALPLFALYWLLFDVALCSRWRAPSSSTRLFA